MTRVQAEPMVWADGTAQHLAVAQTLAADGLTPILAFHRLRRLGAHTLLESVEGDEKVARYSFIALGEWARLVEREGQAMVVEDGGVVATDADPVRLLRATAERLRVPVPSGQQVALPFVGGAVGYFGYDWIRRWERLPSRHPPVAPAWEWVWPTAVVGFDHREQAVTIIAEARRDARDEAQRRLQAILAALREPSAPSPPAARAVGPVVANQSPEAFLEAVRRAKRYIEDGDIFQVVLSQRLAAPVSGDAFDLYRRLRRVNPSPYLFYLETPRQILVGSSPEVLVKVTGKQVLTRPIAGTRPRGATSEDDARLWEELIHDPKERAEHTMLVDLARNDLGRVARYGTVTVDRLMIREAYSHVMHIVSEVRATLADGLDALDALQATFPAGTLTGAPKIRAMEIIDELEPEGRGAYGGTVGYLSHRGDLDACITIRTITVQNGVASVQAGGGVVADSVPENEYQESWNKARAGLSALEGGDAAWV